jgi:DNA-binding transcriptional regulator YiaG
VFIKDAEPFWAGNVFLLDIDATTWHLQIKNINDQTAFMKSEELIKIRQEMKKTQRDMAILLGTSLKAIQSYEQGWRPVPDHLERHLYFLQVLKKIRIIQPCWITKNCSSKKREKCPAWELQNGHLCWFINGTICDGKIQKNWKTKMDTCKECDVFKPVLSEKMSPSIT